MEQPNRQYALNQDYRYGFNGKENDREWGTASLTQDYGFRLYNPAIAKFLSVDPLAPSYPWNSTYAFAENDVIRSIDLDGAEKLIVTVYSPIGIGHTCGDIHCTQNLVKTDKPGSAEIIIKMQYIVVTKGMGSFTRPELIDPIKFNNLYNEGDMSMKASHLPTATNYLIEASKSNISKGDYYDLKIDYDYSIVNGENDITLYDAIEWVKVEPQSRGIIMTPIETADVTTFQAQNKNAKTPFSLESTIVSASHSVKSQVFTDPNTAGYAFNEQFSKSTFNLVFMSPLYYNIKAKATFSFGTGASSTELVVHETGHNAAYPFIHNKGNYEYNQKGLQSNQPYKIRPTPQNTKDIINDKTNRSTIP